MRVRGFARAALAAAALAVVLAVAGALWFRAVAFGDRRLPSRSTTLVVPNGATGREIARLLADDGIVANALAFEFLARLEGVRSQFKAGEFRFAPHRSIAEILDQIVTGGSQVAVWVTIPEGFTAREIGATLRERGLVRAASGFDALALRGSLELGGTRTHTLEGCLFPDTYLLPLDATPAQVVKILTDRFRAELPSDAAARAKALGLTVPQAITVASLVEREAKYDDERALMAGVYYNRLRRGMPLQVDATIEYAFPAHKDVITRADLAIDSPYNTYEHRGLPPGPIANPGKASLRAAFHPQASDYLYYVAMGNGRSAFSRTLAEHNANVARYLR
jgi:UPF0755 protein